MRIDIPGTKKVRQNSFCCPLISVNITPPWMGKTEELGKLPSIQSYSGRHFGFQNQKGGRRGFWDEDSLLHSPFLLLGYQKADSVTPLSRDKELEGSFVLQNKVHSTVSCSHFSAASVFVVHSGIHSVVMATFRLRTLQAFHIWLWVPLQMH